MNKKLCMKLVVSFFLVINCIVSTMAQIQLPNGRYYFDLPATSNIEEADDNCNHILYGNPFGYPDINWFGPGAGEYYVILHRWMQNLGAAYHQTKNEKYAREWIYEIKDWTADCLPDWPSNSSAGEATSMRCTNWISAWLQFTVRNNSSSISSGERTLFLNSLEEQANYLSTVPNILNQGIRVNNSLFRIAVLFPEFKNSASWYNTSVSKLQTLMANGFLSDGGYAEVTYPMIGDFIKVYDLAQMNNRHVSLPVGFLKPLQAPLVYSMYYSKPNGKIGDWGDVYSDVWGEEGLPDYGENLSYYLDRGAAMFNRQDMKYVASAGASGTPPTEISKLFPVTGHCFMRSGWGTTSDFDQQLYLGFASNPANRWLWHTHFDWLDIEVYAYGKDLIRETGYQTETGEVENWGHRTAGHNTITVDNKDQVLYDNTEWTYGVFCKGPLPTSNGYSNGTPLYGVKNWETNTGFDFADGWLQSRNYPVKHERKIFFIRDEYWIISDLMTSTDTVTNHSYEQYYHLPKDYATWTNTTVNETSKKLICTGNNLIILPADPGNISSYALSSFNFPPDNITDGYGAKSNMYVKYVKTGSAPVTFETVIYPYRSKTPVITLTRLAVYKNSVTVNAHTASGFKIDIDRNNDYYLITHDTTATKSYDYGTYHLNGVIGYIRKDDNGKILNIQVYDGTELKDNGVLITKIDKRSNISSKGGVLEIKAVDGTSIKSYQVWCPTAKSVKINGALVKFTQNGNYVTNPRLW